MAKVGRRVVLVTGAAGATYALPLPEIAATIALPLSPEGRGGAARRGFARAGRQVMRRPREEYSRRPRRFASWPAYALAQRSGSWIQGPIDGTASMTMEDSPVLEHGRKDGTEFSFSHCSWRNQALASSRRSPGHARRRARRD